MSETNVNAYRLELAEKKRQSNILDGEINRLEVLIKSYEKSEKSTEQVEQTELAQRSEELPQASQSDVVEENAKELKPNVKDNPQPVPEKPTKKTGKK